MNDYKPLIDNSRPFSRIFSFRGRSTQKECNVICMGIGGLYFLIMLLLEYLKMHFEILRQLDITMYFFFLGFPVYLYLLCAVSSRRMHDFGKPFSIGNITIRRILGESFEEVEGFNKYGSDPRQPYEPQLEAYYKMLRESSEE